MSANGKKYYKTIALIWSASLVLFFMFYIAVLSPQHKSKQQIDNKLTQEKQAYQDALSASQQKNRELLKKQIENLRNKLKDFVIDFEDSANLTLDISQMAGRKKISSFSIEGSGKRRKSAQIPGCGHITENRINISFTAGFNQFAMLLNALERHRPVVFVDNLEIVRSQQKSSDNKADVDVELTVFVKKPQESEDKRAI